MRDFDRFTYVVLSLHHVSRSHIIQRLHSNLTQLSRACLTVLTFDFTFSGTDLICWKMYIHVHVSCGLVCTCSPRTLTLLVVVLRVKSFERLHPGRGMTFDTIMRDFDRFTYVVLSPHHVSRSHIIQRLHSNLTQSSRVCLTVLTFDFTFSGTDLICWKCTYAFMYRADLYVHAVRGRSHCW